MNTTIEELEEGTTVALIEARDRDGLEVIETRRHRRVGAKLATWFGAMSLSLLMLSATARADIYCQNKDHTHWHVCCHTDHYDFHRFFESGGVWYAEWHVHEHGDYLYKRC